jgi:uncharacterized damage-inducible protein DinB
MTLTAVSPSQLDSERTDLLAELATARAALRNAVRELSDEQAGARPTASTLCLGGLVKHVTAVEENWMRFVLEGPSAMSYDLPDGVTWADLMSGNARELPTWMAEREDQFRMAPWETLADVLTRYEHVAARTDELVATLPDLSATQPLPEAPWHEPGATHSVRRVVVHVIAETTQHAGHADIIRETLDGAQST